MHKIKTKQQFMFLKNNNNFPQLTYEFIKKKTMNDADVSRQIQQMVRFIRQEAEEKANEISVSAEEVH